MQTLYSLLTHLKNGMKYEKACIEVPYSLTNFRVLHILRKEGFIMNFFRSSDYPNLICVLLRPSLGDFFKDLKFFSRTSTISLKSYLELPSLIGCTNFGVITTNLGIMDLKQAYRLKVGGRILFTI